MKWWIVGILLLLATPIFAQDTVITQDDVTVVAERMYCAVCENVPLDDCGSPTCMQWKQEIADMLGAGKTADEIIQVFVDRYGQKVLGVPQDPVLNLLAWVFPIVASLVVGVFGFLTFWRWRKNQPLLQTEVVTKPNALTQDAYRALLEDDLNR